MWYLYNVYNIYSQHTIHSVYHNICRFIGGATHAERTACRVGLGFLFRNQVKKKKRFQAKVINTIYIV